MTKAQAAALKPGDIVVEKSTGDQFLFLKLMDVTPMELKNGDFGFGSTKTELAVELIPSFEYARRRVTNGPFFLFDYKKMMLKEETE